MPLARRPGRFGREREDVVPAPHGPRVVLEAARHPGPGDLSISDRSAQLGDVVLGSGNTRHYQAWYRDPVASYCPDPPGKNYNVTNATSVGW